MTSGAAARTDGWVTVAPGRQSGKSGERYKPPAEISAVTLWDALEGTGRRPERPQMDMLRSGDANAVPDVRLYYSGDLSLLRRPCVAIVGTRQVSDLGRRRTVKLARQLVEAGVIVVSGLAYGVDTAAHETAIEHGGRTIAVIGTPLDKASPSENARLQEHIYRDHLLVSQFPHGTKTFPANFPVRNRLMATLTDATVVMEASDTSGTLHQAAECTKLGRWLFIAKSVVDDQTLSWPKKFLKYETTAPLEHVSQITDLIQRS